VNRQTAVVLVATALLAGTAVAADGDAAKIEAEITERLSWQTPLFVPDDKDVCADVKACTQKCRSYVSNIYGGSELWPAAAACESMGDMWDDGRAHKKGKKFPEAGMRSWYTACYLGDARACEKEAAYFETTGADVPKAFAIRAAACIKGHTESCLTGGAMVEKHKLPYDAEPMLSWAHVPACDDRQVAESCAWTEQHKEASDKYRLQRKVWGELDALPSTSQGVGADPKIDPGMLKATHRPLWTAYAYDWAPQSVIDTSGSLAIYHCYEVWIPKEAGDDRAIQATVDQAQKRYAHTIDPKVVTLDKTNPRAKLQPTPCWGRTQPVLVE
jgi:hypothetical protein